MSIRSVADEAGVSTATASRVINHNPAVDPKLSRRVWKAVDKLGYVPNTQARALVSGQSRILGVLISDMTNPFFPELLQGFEDSAVEIGYETLIGSTSHDVDKMDQCVNRMLQRNVDGVAVMTFGIREPLLEKLASHGMPLVFTEAAPPGVHSSAIKIDYSGGLHEGVQHLAVLGHRRIAFITGPPHVQSAVTRRNAFCAALERIGIAVQPSYIVEGDHSLDSGLRATQKLLALPEAPTAIMCSNDLTAIGAMHAVHRSGLSVPNDISIIGFDDVDVAQFMLPPLTTIRTSRLEIAKAAVKALKSHIDGEVLADQLIGSKLVVRQSTSIPAGTLGDLNGIATTLD